MNKNLIFNLRIFTVMLCVAFMDLSADATTPIPPSGLQFFSSGKLATQTPDVVKLSWDITQDTEHSNLWLLDLTAKIQESFHINSKKPASENLIPTELTVSVPDGVDVVSTSYPPDVLKSFAFSENDMKIYEGAVHFISVLNVDVSKLPELENITLRAVLKYQACNDEKCLVPTQIVADIPFVSSSNVIKTGDFQKVGDAPQHIDSKNRIDKLLNENSIIIALFFLFVAGLSMNLTPCIYPMIPVTVSYFTSANKKCGDFGRALAYFLGIVTAYSILGVVAGMTGTLFGGLLQHPSVLIGFALLMLYFSAGMFGWVPFELPQFAVQTASGRLPLGAFGMGATMGIVAAPCIGPVIAALLTYVGSKQSALLGFSLFFVFSAGLGTPYLIFGIYAGKISQLPKSGAWLGVVKTIFGFILLGVAVYFISPLISESSENMLYSLVIALSSISTVVYSFGRRVIVKTLLVAVAFGLLLMAYNISAHKNISRLEGFWTPYSLSELKKSNQLQKPVLLDFYAEWCLPCEKLDIVTYSDTGLQMALAETVKLKVDVTKIKTAESIEVMKKFNVTGVPTAIYLNDKGIERFRIEGFFQPDVLEEKLAQVTGKNIR